MSRNIKGETLQVNIAGTDYVIDPVDIGILKKAQAKLQCKEPSLREHAEAIALFAGVAPVLARQLYDSAVERQKTVPMQDVIEYVTDDLEGFAFTLTAQFEKTYPDKFKDGTLTEDLIVSAVMQMAGEEPEKYQDLVEKRNVTSSLATPKNPSSASESLTEESTTQTEAEESQVTSQSDLMQTNGPT